jgi:hypothetical protein
MSRLLEFYLTLGTRLNIHAPRPGRSAVWLAHLTGGQGAEGSNPFAPTIFPFFTPDET